MVIATALIDGNYYLTEAETFQGVVTTVSYKNESITVDGDEYFQSEIDSDAYVAALDMFEDIQVADEKTEYVFYTDLFGYVRAYTYVDATTTYGLLTEAYVDNYFNGKYVKKNVGIAEVTIGDAKTAEYIVTNLGTATKNPNPFFTNVDNVGADAELVPALSTTAGDTVTSTTNIAKYSGLTEDEITLKSAEQRGTGLKTLEIVELKNNVDISAKARSYDAVNDKYVSANKDTEYYFVYVDHNIAYRVGYSEVPAMKAANITAAYALTQVTTNDSTATKEYGVAKVIVFETNANVVRSAADTILGYYNTSKTTSKVQAIDSILGAGTLSTVYEDNTWYDSKFDEIAFYDTYAGKNENVTLDKITRNFASYRIYAGQIDRIEGLDYIKVDQTTAGATLDLDLTETKAPVYVLNNSKKDVVTAEEITLTAKKNTGDEIIWVENKKGEVIYVVDVTKSIDAATDATFTDIKDLYNDIIADGVVAPTPAPLYDQLVAKFNALDKTDPAKVSALKAEITAADTSSMKGSEIADLNNKAAYLGNLETAQAAVAAAANGYGKGTLGWSDEAAAAAIDAGYEDLAALAASDLVGFDTTLNTGAAAGVWSTMTAAATQVDGDAAAAVAAADAALTAIKTALNGKTATTATVTDASVESFKAAIDAAVAAMVTDPKASVSVSDYGDVATQVASLGTAGNITVTGVKITLSYQGASSTQGQDLGAITVPYNML